MIVQNKIVTKTDKIANNIYNELNDRGLAECIKLVSGGCKRTFPLTDESLAGVCALSIFGFMSDVPDTTLQAIYKLIQQKLQVLLTSDIRTSEYEVMGRDILIAVYLHEWEPFIALGLEIKNKIGISSDFYNALIDDITSRATHVRMHYGVIKGDEVYASM